MALGKDYFQKVSPLGKLLVLLSLLPVVILQGNHLFLLLDVFLLAVLAHLAGKKIKWLYFVLMVCSVSLFHLLTPWGRILFQIGPLRITQGALLMGLKKGLTIVGLVFLSLAGVDKNLKLPGSFGRLLCETLYYLEIIIEGKKHLHLKKWVEGVDSFLLQEFPPGKEGGFRYTENSPKRDGTPWPMGILFILLLCIFWGPLIFTFFYS